MKLYENNVGAAEESARQAHDLYPENVQSRAILEEIQKIRDGWQ
jgi:succinate dehydrogenase/fumarate reductase flavoprotein subunit